MATTIDQNIIDAGKLWVQRDMNEETRKEIQSYIDTQNTTELKKRLTKRLEFGTAGLRGPMGAGNCFMNELVVVQTAQGLLKYMQSEFGEKLKDMGIAVGYDHRALGSLTSKVFAELTAAVFLSQNVPVYLYEGFVATPLVPFCVDYKKCAAGIMVTASHNPKQDNGYKVYWSNGCQIIPPHDSGIAKAIDDNLDPWQTYDVSTVRDSKICFDPTEEACTAFFQQMKDKLCRFPEDNANAKVKVAYSAMHGVGHKFTSQSFKAFSLPHYVEVKEQLHPDPEFPTVAFPNPEEGKGALKLSFQAADANGCSVVLANDPDADRLAVAEKQQSGEWRVFTGNEIGTLMGYWEWLQCRKNHGEIPNEDIYIVASTVSSKMLRAVAHAEGFNFEETLTGFKWMGNESVNLREKGKTVVFSFEEAIGFCAGDLVKDKDGVTAAAVFAEMANQLSLEGKTLSGQLDYLSAKYGIFLTKNHYVKCYDGDVILAIFNRLRNNGQYWDSCGKYKIKYIRDLTTGYDNSKPENKAVLPTSSSSQMITYTFENGCVATLRTSGTEPKLKYYVELPGEVGREKDSIQAELDDIVQNILDLMLEPEKNNLEVPKQE